MQLVAEVIDQEALTVGTEITRARIADCAIVADLEEAVAIDRQIQRILRVVDVALIELLRNVRHQHTAALRVFPGAEHGGRIHIGELRTRLLEAHGAGVGNVVAGDIEIFTRRTQAAKTDIEGH